MHLIRAAQPVGRRTLAQMSGLTERVLRSETDFLKDQGLIHISKIGMSLSQEGSEVLLEMEEVTRELFGLQELEQALETKLGLNRVVVVMGDTDESPWVKADLGRAAADQLRQLVQQNWVISVAGGTTVAAVSEALTSSTVLKSLLFVPARGGLGEEVELQANTISSKMAKQTDGRYRLLHVPDELSVTSYQSLLSDPQIKEVVRLIRSSRMIIHGIGEAKTMAKRRKSPQEVIDLLTDRHAVAEAFGYYFNAQGDIVHKIRTIGLRLEDVRQADHILAVAGGKNKASAIRAFLKQGVHDVLVTDEGAAREILKA